MRSTKYSVVYKDGQTLAKNIDNNIYIFNLLNMSWELDEDPDPIKFNIISHDLKSFKVNNEYNLILEQYKMVIKNIMQNIRKNWDADTKKIKHHKLEILKKLKANSNNLLKAKAEIFL